jgi:hypothetical protein
MTMEHLKPSEVVIEYGDRFVGRRGAVTGSSGLLVEHGGKISKQNNDDNVLYVLPCALWQHM